MLNSFQPGLRSSVHRIAVWLYLLVAVSSGLGLLGKAQLVRRILPVSPALVFPVILVFIVLPFGWPLAVRARRFLAPIVCLGIVCASVFIYPRMQGLKNAGRGSDQPDCVIVAAEGMGSLQWPYDTAKLWTHDPMSCGPGWVLLQTPAIIATGYRWNLIILWAIAILLLRSRIGQDMTASVLTLVGLSAVTWVAASDGTDFLPFGVLLAALFVAQQARSRYDPIFLILVVLVVQFRFPMLILPILFFPRNRISQGVSVSLVAFSFQLFFLLWRPEAYIAGGPLHLFYKLTHSHLLALTRWAAALEVSLAFAVMVGVALLVRRYISTPWVGFGYLVALTVLPAALDLVRKHREMGSLLAGLGIWEGANWMSGCLPSAALFLVLTSSEFSSYSRAPGMDRADLHRLSPESESGATYNG